MYWAYFELKDKSCEDNIDINYDDYCISDFEHEPMPQKRDNNVCVTDSCDMPDGYTPGTSAPDANCLWNLNYLDGNTNNKDYNHLDSNTALSDIYIIDWGTRTTHNEFTPNPCNTNWFIITN